MSLYPTFSLHLEYGGFDAAVVDLEGLDVCSLKIGALDSLPSLTLFFPASQRAVADEIAAKLNGVAALSKKEAA